MADTQTSSGGIGFCGLLTIVFVVLKILGKITWSWWWVLAPLWLGAVLFIIVFVLVLIAIVAVAAVRGR